MQSQMVKTETGKPSIMSLKRKIYPNSFPPKNMTAVAVDRQNIGVASRP